MDLTEMLDAGGYPSGDESGSDKDDKEDASDDDEDSDEDMSDDDDESITSEDDEGAVDKLDSFVSGLDSKKRKVGRDEAEGAEGKKKKRVVLKERSEAYPEGEFVAVRADETMDGSSAFSSSHLDLD